MKRKNLNDRNLMNTVNYSSTLSRTAYQMASTVYFSVKQRKENAMITTSTAINGGPAAFTKSDVGASTK